MKYQFIKTDKGTDFIQNAIIFSAMAEKDLTVCLKKVNRYCSASNVTPLNEDQFIYAMENLIYRGCFIIA